MDKGAAKMFASMQMDQHAKVIISRIIGLKSDSDLYKDVLIALKLAYVEGRLDAERENLLSSGR